MTPEQEAAIKRARQRAAIEAARSRMAQQPKGLGQRIRENLLGDDDPTTQNTGEKIGSWLNKAGEAMTLGLVGDEATAALEAAAGQDYGQRLAHYRGQEALLEQTNPGAALGAEIAGGVASLALPGAALGTLGRGAGMGARIAASGAAGAGMGGLYGFMEGEGGGRTDTALTGAMWGGGAGALAPVIGAGIQRAADRVVGNRAIGQMAANAPTTDQLRAQARAAYQAVDDAGVQVTPQAFDRLRGDMTQRMADAGLDVLPGPGSLTPNSARVAQIAEGMAGQMAPHPTAALPFSSLDQLRRHAGTAAGSMANRTDSAAGTAAIGAIDDFVQQLGPGDVTTGDARALQSAIGKARDTYARMARSRTIDEAIEASENYVSGSASGIRNQFRRILNSKNLSRGYSDAEKQMMRRVINGSIPERLLHLVGGGLGQLGSIGAGLGIGGIPGAVIGAAVGAGARKGSEAVAQKNAAIVRAIVANGGLKQLPIAPDNYRAITELLLRRIGAAAPSQ